MTLLGIPGDNTYSNYQEASRSFWRQTVLPLVNRTAKALSGWLGPAYGGGLDLRPDLDQIEALASEREALSVCAPSARRGHGSARPSSCRMTRSGRRRGMGPARMRSRHRERPAKYGETYPRVTVVE